MRPVSDERATLELRATTRFSVDAPHIAPARHGQFLLPGAHWTTHLAPAHTKPALQTLLGKQSQPAEPSSQASRHLSAMQLSGALHSGGLLRQAQSAQPTLPTLDAGVVVVVTVGVVAFVVVVVVVGAAVVKARLS